jgi:hypothetical protein
MLAFRLFLVSMVLDTRIPGLRTGPSARGYTARLYRTVSMDHTLLENSEKENTERDFTYGQLRSIQDEAQCQVLPDPGRLPSDAKELARQMKG